MNKRTKRPKRNLLHRWHHTCKSSNSFSEAMRFTTRTGDLKDIRVHWARKPSAADMAEFEVWRKSEVKYKAQLITDMAYPTR